MIHRVVTLGGPPGSGKSTAGRLAARALELEFVSAGERFRAEARRRSVTLEEFGDYAAAHPEVDRELDQGMLKLAAPGRLLEGRIQGALCRRAGISAYTVVVTAAEGERVRRVANRDHESTDTARRKIRERAEAERARYRRFYGIDVDAEPADLTVDSTDLDAPGVAEAIRRFVREREAAL